MENYQEKCRKNLFEYSLEKKNYKTALKEWYFQNEIIDNNVFSGVNAPKPFCELCENEDLRWQFVIYNINNKNELKVGSSCIKKFDIALIDKNGNKIYGKNRNSKINKLITLARIESSNKLTFKALNELCKLNSGMEHNKRFIDCWTQLKVNGTLEPKLAVFLINNFIECGIDYKELDLIISIKKGKCTQQIRKLNETGYFLIRNFLPEKIKNEHDIKFR